ncbi:hypothetical protein CPZ20_10675 [Lacticaseibacillus rhamnosus]|uniref:Uncharacterized protein n=1 Tax=Lacticaseibacillus rhamnosus TaxID=47715 RepID=A0AAX0JZY8_LACRH|nr:hypothetical protein BWR10_11725 [Lacticaseibacillus rhamnosus]PCL28543.1 hypothetical protein CPZ20_10675 [Lacticaseibacillus rhamnosus]PCL36454.1 hypothetical protein CPZ19_10270 [Lacticaseibacillus rhamnosus]PCL39321.1 hypothetical protein CPZ11_10470 [Lacticaseibacillus rhamnosus]PCL42223.1 hypothetical protein CPZ10_10435 [Lacticaseibacillus rhamnosus]
MARAWPLRLRSLHADFCAGERVMGVSRNKSGLSHNGRALAIVIKRSVHANFCTRKRVIERKAAPKTNRKAELPPA